MVKSQASPKPKRGRVEFDFEFETTRYSGKNAYCLAQAAELAYRDETSIREQTGSWGLARCRFFTRRETQAFAAANDKLIIIAFRGTEPNRLVDWMTDADIHLRDGPIGKVHDGFQRTLGYVYPEIRQTITEFQTNAQSLWITGHSLGAALATLAVARLRFEEDKPVYGLYTYGQPRTGNREFERHFNLDLKSRAFRFVNNNDVVTRVPTRALGYSHVGTFLYFDVNGKLHTDTSFWYKLLDGVQGRIEDFLKPGTDGLKDHAMRNYVRNTGINLNTTIAL